MHTAQRAQCETPPPIVYVERALSGKKAVHPRSASELPSAARHMAHRAFSVAQATPTAMQCVRKFLEYYSRKSTALCVRGPLHRLPGALAALALLAGALPLTALFFVTWSSDGGLPVPLARSRQTLESAATEWGVGDDLTNGLRMRGTHVRRLKGDSKCTIVACHTPGAPGAREFWAHYSKSGFSMAAVEFDVVSRNEVPVAIPWCRIPSVIGELQRTPGTRVLYLDLDTKIDPKLWCELPVGQAAPIVMNSYRRTKEFKFEDYTLEGSRVQANVFLVTAGVDGVRAMRRWAYSYYDGQYQEQGAIHLREKGLCGVPGWIACYSNPHQQNCHCAAIKSLAAKVRCIASLYAGTKKGCPL